MRKHIVAISFLGKHILAVSAKIILGVNKNGEFFLVILAIVKKCFLKCCDTRLWQGNASKLGQIIVQVTPL